MDENLHICVILIISRQPTSCRIFYAVNLRQTGAFAVFNDLQCDTEKPQIACQNCNATFDEMAPRTAMAYDALPINFMPNIDFSSTLSGFYTTQTEKQPF